MASGTRAESDLLPAAAAPRPLRGLMVDAARVPEKLDYYHRVIDFCAEWGLNALQFRLADDQGSALRFASVSGLITHTNAFTPEQLRDLAEYGQRHGVDVFPEIESFGHTGYITRSPAFAHLLDRDPNGSSEFSGVTPVDPATLELMTRLYREVASIFPSSYLHGGCDEVNWGGSARSRQALQSRSRAQIWADYLNALNRAAVELRKEFIVWGDFVLHKEPQILALLDKRIVIMDWNYAETNPVPLHDTLEKIAAHGARAIGAPALSCYRWGARVGAEQLRNVDAYANAYLASNDSASLGVVVTNWVPSRYVQNSIWDCFAYAAVALNHGTAAAQTSAFQRFVEKHYQTAWNEQWREVFESFYSAAPYWPGGATASWKGLALPVPWSSDPQLSTVLRAGAPPPNPFTRLASLLVLLEPSVLTNLSDFQAFALCVRYLERAFWRETVAAEQASRQPLDRARATQVIRAIAARDQALADALTRDWEVGRFADAPAASQPVIDLEPKDQLLFQWKQAARYSASLAQNPDHFCGLLQG
ncbi:MAG TPA: family 20 glycosylhydrolase [Acidobacteriaceae bacterium]|nr:family 20 glycosylhydrolase [Acidobacteriaceae bacterium]